MRSVYKIKGIWYRMYFVISTLEIGSLHASRHGTGRRSAFRRARAGHYAPLPLLDMQQTMP